MRPLIILSLLWMAVGGPCCEAQAQPPISIVETSEPITLVESKSFVWDGFANPRVVDGKLVADVTSKPKFVGATSQILLSLADGYTVSEIVAESLPALEYVDLTEADAGGKTELSFPPDAKAGQYRIAVKAAKSGVSRQAIKRLNVTIGGSGPTPPDVDDGPKNDIERIVDNAVFEIRKGYASVFKQTADEVGSGRLKTDADLLKFMVPVSKAAREQAIAGIDGLIQDKLPRDGITLKPEAPIFLREIATAFERGLK